MNEDAQRSLIAKLNRQRQKSQYEAYQRNRKRIEEEKRRRKKPKIHAVEIELTKRQSEELLYVAFKPTKKDLCLKRYVII